MLQRIWKTKSVLQRVLYQQSSQQNQINTPVQSADTDNHLPNTIGCKIIEMEMLIEDGKLTKGIIIELLHEYTKAVEFYEEKEDSRYKMYKKKMTNLLQREAVDAVLKGQQNAGAMLLRRQKAQQQVRRATQLTKGQALELLQNSEAEVQKQQTKIKKQVSRQMESLQKRLHQRSISQYDRTPNKAKNTLNCINALDKLQIPGLPKNKKRDIRCLI